MLPDYKQNLQYSPVRFRHVHEITITADVATNGVATLRTAESSPNVTIAQNGAGRYDVTFPKGQIVVYANGLVQKDTAPVTADGTTVAAALVLPLLGTATFWTLNGAAGVPAIPSAAAATVLRLRLELGKI